PCESNCASLLLSASLVLASKSASSSRAVVRSSTFFEVITEEREHLTAQHAPLDHQRADPSQERRREVLVDGQHLERGARPALLGLPTALQNDDGRALPASARRRRPAPRR